MANVYIIHLSYFNHKTYIRYTVNIYLIRYLVEIYKWSENQNVMIILLMRYNFFNTTHSNLNIFNKILLCSEYKCLEYLNIILLICSKVNKNWLIGSRSKPRHIYTHILRDPFNSKHSLYWKVVTLFIIFSLRSVVNYRRV